MRQSDDRLLIIEMTRVSPPFLRDAGRAYLDDPPEFLPDELARQQWDTEKREQFESNWPKVQAILRELESRYGVHIADVNPGNIRFASPRQSFGLHPNEARMILGIRQSRR